MTAESKNKMNMDKASMLKSKTLIIQVPFGGLGDNLWCSHLPRVAKQTKVYDKVYISNSSIFRRFEYKKYIWELNPFIDGFIDEEVWYPGIVDVEEEMNILDKIMLEYGMDDGVRFHEPELYFKPKIRDDLKGKNVYDPNFISYTGKIGLKNLQKYFKKPANNVQFQMKQLGDSAFPLQKTPTLEAKSFEDYCSIIASCNNFYALTSGGATLAPALGKSCTVLYGKKHKSKFRHSRLCRYVFIDHNKPSILERAIKTIAAVIRG